MNVVDQATRTQLQNIQTRTGKTLDELFALIRESGLTKHGQIRDMLKSDLGMGHGDANTLAGAYLKAGEGGAPARRRASPDDVLDEIYAGPKAALRPIHEKLMLAITTFGAFEIAPKKGYVSLRRTKQFATIGPTTNTRRRSRPQHEGRARDRPPGRVAAKRHVPVQSQRHRCGPGRPGAHGVGLAGLRQRGVRARRQGAPAGLAPR